MSDVKDFRWVGMSSKGKIEKRMTYESIKSCAEMWYARFTRVTGTGTDEAEHTEVYAVAPGFFHIAVHTLTLFKWTKLVLTQREKVTVSKTRAKHNFSKHDLERILVTLWAFDDTTFIHERARSQTTLVLDLYCWTGARIGAFFTGGLRYQVRAYGDLRLLLMNSGHRLFPRSVRCRQHARRLELFLPRETAMGQSKPGP